MASTFKNYVASAVGTSANTLCTSPGQTTVIGMSIANIIAAPVTVDVYVTISAANYYLVKGATVPVGGSLVPIGGDQKVVLETGDAIKVVSSTASSVDVIVSTLEIT
jgi:hypothetical protein